jgi:3-dehydroquinate synthase
VFEGALAARLDRRTTFVALGGGVVGDMAGFAAASYQRGVSFLQLPTSLMAMVDSSVGGKTGVNMPGGKNMVGAFWQPRAVLCDTEVLATLPDRELASGLAEVVKYGLIRDAELFGWLEAGGAADVLARKHGALAHAVSASCTNKAAVVGADERETDDSAAGGRATLNLGHTFGHAIEASQGYGAWLHGEAVAIGTAMAADLSHRLGWIDDSVLRRTRDLLAACHLPTAAPAGMSAAAFSQLMAVDKKAARGFVRLILLRGALGGCVFTHEYDAAALAATLDAFCDEAAPRSTPPARIALLQH